MRWGWLLGIVAAAPALVYLWGFTVDDALIPARYATHLARGLGYRFNSNGPSTDGVTPLGWAHLLAPFAGQGPLAALRAARILGALAWLGAAALLGEAIARIGGLRWRYAALLIILFSPCLGAWASAGLETGVVIALSTAAAALPAGAAYSPAGAALAGTCAWLRPEMIAYASVLGAGRAVATHGLPRRTISLLLAVGPWFVAAAIRWIAWGRPAPLAVLAKPSDLSHGLVYVLGAFALSGAFVAVFAPIALRKLPLWSRVLTGASLAHLAAVAVAGGDWMPLARLVAPILPPLVLVAAQLLAEPASSLMARLRLALGCAGELSIFYMRGPSARRVLADRMELIDAARPHLAGAARVAAIDIGWVGAATDADIVDLAGATDPQIASLPGGHTSKAISAISLLGREPDRLVFELDPRPYRPIDDWPRFARAVEVHLGTDPVVRKAYRVSWISPDTLPIRYGILSKSSPRDPTLDGSLGD